MNELMLGVGFVGVLTFTPAVFSLCNKSGALGAQVRLALQEHNVRSAEVLLRQQFDLLIGAGIFLLMDILSGTIFLTALRSILR